MLVGITYSKDMNFSKFQEMMKDREDWHAAIHGVTKSWLFRWPKYWSFRISPFNEYSGLIFFRIDWFDLLAVQETLKSLLQYHSSKASVLWRSASFISILNQSAVVT